MIPSEALVDLRLRSRISDEELEGKVGKIITEGDYNLLATGPCRIRRPDGTVLAVYLPGVLAEVLDTAYPVLHDLRRLQTENRGVASGSPRVTFGEQKRSYARRVASGVIGAIDGSGSLYRFCRLTAWTGEHVPEWESLRPVLHAVAEHFAQHVPDRYAVQKAEADRSNPAWVVPGTPFTTITCNNSWATGVHQDAGDLEAGFSTLAVLRRGAWTGGALVLPRYRLAFEMDHGALLLFDAHEWHGNTVMRCDHQDEPLNGPCPAGCERVSLVSYFRSKIVDCGSPEEEYARAAALGDRRSKLADAP